MIKWNQDVKISNLPGELINCSANSDLWKKNARSSCGFLYKIDTRGDYLFLNNLTIAVLVQANV